MSLTSLLDKPFVVHCVGVEKEADLIPAFAVSLFSVFLLNKLKLLLFIYLFT